MNLTPTTGHPAKNSPHKIVSEIRKIAPPMLYSLYHQSLSNMNNPTIIEQLQCPICLNILCQPPELSCRALVCTDCLVQAIGSCSCEVKCPCYFIQSPIQPQQLKPAPPLIQTLLKDIMVKCVRCKRDIRAGDYDTHEYSTYQSGGEDVIKGPEKTGFHESRINIVMYWRKGKLIRQVAESIHARFNTLQRT